MNDEQGARAALAAALQRLLRGAPVDSRQGGYIEGEGLAVLLDPQLHEPDRHDLLVTVLPLATPAPQPTGLALVLRDEDGLGPAVFGRLNERGQLRFHNLAGGAYRLTCRLPGGGALTTVAIPALRAAAAASGPEAPGSQIRAAGGQLAAHTLRRAAGELELHFAAPDRRWDGHVVIFAWAPGEEPAPGLSARLCAPLTWSERDQACVAQLLLGDGAEVRSLSLPEAPGSPELLAAESPETVHASVEAAARAQTLRAWQRLLEEWGPALPADVVSAIGAALARRRDSY